MQKPLEQFGNYQIVRRLGVGGMAETFLAVRSGPGGFEQRVCLKRILPAYSDDESFVDLFLSEARIAAKLRHNHIVGVVDFGEWDGVYFIALELIEGVDLRALLRAQLERRLPPEIGVLIATDIAKALDYAHRRLGSGRGIVHRDVSPSNVLISYEGEVKLTDFGIAKVVSNTGSASAVVKGKVPYMAPETANASRVDGRTDLFSLGVMLYELLSGRRPFDGRTQAETLANILRGKFEPLASRCPTAPADLAQICDRLLQFQPEDRYASARLLLNELSRLTPSPIAYWTLGRLVEDVRPKELLSSPDARATEQGNETTSRTHRIDIEKKPLPHIQAKPDANTRTHAPDQLRETVEEPKRKTVEIVPTPSEPPAAVLVSEVVPSEVVPSEVVPSEVVSSDIVQPAFPVARPNVLSKRWLAAGAVLGAAVLGWVLWPSPHRTATNVPPPPFNPRSSLPQGGLDPSKSTSTATPVVAPAPRATSTSRVLDTKALGTGDASTEKLRAEAREEHASQTATNPERSRAADIDIGVSPFGKVWIDGQLAGTTPVRTRIAPGRHEIAAAREESGQPEMRRTVRIRPGHNVTVRFELSTKQANVSSRLKR